MRLQKCAVVLSFSATLFSVGVRAEHESGDNAFADIAGRWYVSPMFSATAADKARETDDGTGWMLAVGKQVNHHFNLELYGFQTDYDSRFNGQKDSRIQGIGLSAYGFPFATGKAGSWLGGAYGLVGVGYGDGKDFPERPGFFDGNQNRYLLDAGVGYLLRIPFIRFASLRLDARYRLDLVEEPYAAVDGDDDENEESNFEELVLSAGLMIPIGAKAAPPPPPPSPPPTVVAPIQICADGQDNDGDGRVDFPADPGCSAADDVDEIDPAQCSDGKDNDGDGLIDFPGDKGCADADDTDETDPCKTPDPGEKVSLRGCGTGDVIVLRGVNFEFDESRLTANAKTILDGVVEELVAYPDIRIELGGHTDAKGSDEYNQTLSERRSASVVSYLASKGIAKDRMTVAGYGESAPVADNETEEGRELNRRVELKVTAGTGLRNTLPAAADSSLAPTEAAPDNAGLAGSRPTETATEATPGS